MNNNIHMYDWFLYVWLVYFHLPSLNTNLCIKLLTQYNLFGMLYKTVETSNMFRLIQYMLNTRCCPPVTREFKKLRQPLQQKRHLKTELCVRRSVFAIIIIPCFFCSILFVFEGSVISNKDMQFFNL